MKKSLGLFIAFIPLLASCNKNTGFHYAIPGDKYNPIGFRFNSDEEVVRSLTTDESNLVSECAKEETAKLLNTNILKCESEIHERDYSLAFAGVFKSGYELSNSLNDDKVVTYRYDAESKNDDYRTRTVSKTVENNHLEIYTYGQVEEHVLTNSYYYFADDKTPPVEAADKEKSASLNLREQKTNEKKEYSSVTDTLQIKNTEYEQKLNDYLYLKQNTYLKEPDSRSGVDKEGNIILAIPSQKQHGDDGIYRLKDGRKYQASDNSLQVIKLKKMTKDSDKSTYKKPWVMVTYARTYSEVVITSDVIQPNVPVTKLSSPATIKFSEKIEKFSNSNEGYTQDSLPEVTK